MRSNLSFSNSSPLSSPCQFPNSLSKMDPRDVIPTRALEIVREKEREKKRPMEVKSPCQFPNSLSKMDPRDVIPTRALEIVREKEREKKRPMEVKSPCLFSKSFSEMDLRHAIAMALEIVFAEEREKKRRMELKLEADLVALQRKERERSMLKREIQEMLAMEAAKKTLVDAFMVFITATENNDLAQNFDQNEIMNTIATMMGSEAGNDGGFLSGYGDINLHGIDLSPEERGAIDGLVALKNGVGCIGGANGGFAGGHGDINLHGIDLSPEEEGAIDALVALKNGVGCLGGVNGGFADGHGGINNAPEKAHNGEEDRMTATEGTKCDGGEGSSAGDHDGN